MLIKTANEHDEPENKKRRKLIITGEEDEIGSPKEKTENEKENA